jgi:hypothetical protein
VKIHISYKEKEEALEAIKLLKPILPRFKVKKSTGRPPYKHIYFIPKKCGKPTE